METIASAASRDFVEVRRTGQWNDISPTQPSPAPIAITVATNGRTYNLTLRSANIKRIAANAGNANCRFAKFHNRGANRVRNAAMTPAPPTVDTRRFPK
jgi:hypothetical protein